MKKYEFLYLAALISGISACSDDMMRDIDPETDLRQEIRLQAEIDQLNLSRADDSGFADGDRIGIYAVSFLENGTPGALKATGNMDDNVAFTFNEAYNEWKGDKGIYFHVNTPVDIYGYYPYIPSITDTDALPFSVKDNQAETYGKMSGYEASDFLWGKKAGVTITDKIVYLTFKHILASVEVTLEEGPGFDSGEWASLDKHVTITGTRRDAEIDLSTGAVTVSGNSRGSTIVAAGAGSSFRAIVIPQTVSGIQLFSITIGDRTYNFSKEDQMVYRQGKMHKFVIRVNKSEPKGDYEFTLVDEAVTMWESDLFSHDGGAKEYIVVNNAQRGRLQSVIDSMKLDPAEIVNLKVTGMMSDVDFRYIRSCMYRLEAVNLYDADLSVDGYLWYEHVDYCLPDSAFCNMRSLKSCVLPKKLEAINGMAFTGTSLTGSLDIPEGVKFIGPEAFSSDSYYGNNNLTGTLTLPSTLKIIEAQAFNNCDFTGELHLPDGLESIGGHAFYNCQNFTGELRIPDSVTEIGSGAFYGMRGISGWVTFPKKLNVVSGLGGQGMILNGIIWPDEPMAMAIDAFCDVEFRSDVVIPETVETLGRGCFRKAKMRYVKLPSALISIPPECFSHCTELTDTFTIPENVEYIGEYAFAYCNNIQALVLPAKLRRIEYNAFEFCFSIQHIRCDAKEPPKLGADVFNGIEMNNFTLEVPEESVDAYRSAPGWCEFKRISAYKNFVARPSKCNVLNKGCEREIVLNADGAWEMTGCPSWCHIDRTSGTKKTELTLTVDEMARGSSTRSGKVEFRLKGGDGYTTHIDVMQYDYEYDEDQPLTLQKATRGNGIDLVFLGDGYDADDISSGLYLEDMKQEMEYLFGVEPYTTYRDYFNVYTSFALSEDSGVESLKTWRSTKFSVDMGDGCSKSKRISADWQKTLDYCAEIFPSTVNRPDPRVGCILVGNTDIYDGVTYLNGESFCAVVTKSTASYPNDARGIVQHEAAGHGIGWLGDEYIYHPTENIKYCDCKCCGHVDDLMREQSMGFSLNMSLTGQYKEVPWSHLIFNPAYQDIVDIYEGGYFHKRGIYRSEMNSCMNDNVPYFSTWSRQLIVQRIMKLAGETFSLDSFYAKDSRARGSDFSSTSRSGSHDGSRIPVLHGNAPVRTTGYKYGKKGGRI